LAILANDGAGWTFGKKVQAHSPPDFLVPLQRFKKDLVQEVQSQSRNQALGLSAGKK